MKTISLAVLALIGTTSAVRVKYTEAEGPTKVDFGEDDEDVTMREKDNDYDIGGAKFHGWTNPLAWTDSGADDDKVITQLNQKMNLGYAEAEGPTKVDFGEDDHNVLEREADKKYLLPNGAKHSGWVNPLSWTDDGTDDDRVIAQLHADIALNNKLKL